MGTRLNKIYLLIPFFFFSRCAYSQLQVKTDALGFFYVMNEDVLIKQEAPPFPQFQFSFLNIGVPRSIDVTNPLRPFIFFKDQGCIVFFDNELNQAGSTFYLNTNNDVQITACCGSKGNAFWIYDHLNRQLQLLDRNGNVLIQTPRLEIQTELIQLLELGQGIYGLDALGNVFVFNLYGNLLSKTFLDGAKLLSFQDQVYLINHEGVVYLNGHVWLILHQLNPQKVNLNLLDIIDFKLIEYDPKTKEKKVICNLNN